MIGSDGGPVGWVGGWINGAGVCGEGVKYSGPLSIIVCSFIPPLDSSSLLHVLHTKVRSRCEEWIGRGG